MYCTNLLFVRSILVTPGEKCSIFDSATPALLPVFSQHHVAEPYSTAGLTTVLHFASFILTSTLLLHITAEVSSYSFYRHKALLFTSRPWLSLLCTKNWKYFFFFLIWAHALFAQFLSDWATMAGRYLAVWLRWRSLVKYLDQEHKQTGPLFSVLLFSYWWSMVKQWNCQYRF